MERFAKQVGIPIGLILIKLLVTLRTGLDTYHVSADPLDVLVIDGAYLTLWLIAAYAGKGQEAMALRPFAAGGAWVLYGLMLYIAVKAGQLNGEGAAVAVSLIARVAGAVLLLYDTYDYAQALFAKRSKSSSNTWQDTLRGIVNALAYVIGALVAMPLVLLLNIGKATRDYWQDGKPTEASSLVVVGKAEPVLLPPVANTGTRGLLLDVWREQPLISNPQAGLLVGLSGERVRQLKAKMQQEGVLHVNGHGVEILEVE